MKIATTTAGGKLIPKQSPMPTFVMNKLSLLADAMSNNL
jgi:hypothetical protein